jgi:hypothetical protein
VRGRDIANKVESDKPRVFRVGNEKPALSLTMAATQYTQTLNLS